MTALACPQEAAPGHFAELEFITAPLVIRAQVLAVHWAHDERAGETGYALLYRCFGDTCAMTMLVDERSEHDAPLYLEDWLELRRVGEARHTIVRNLTTDRADDAQRVDWVMVWANGTQIAPAQQPRAELEQRWQADPQARGSLLIPKPAGLDPAGAETRDAHLRQQHPEIARFLDKVKARTAVVSGAGGQRDRIATDRDLPPIDPPHAVHADGKNGGW